jgi:hypothetical protein
MSTSIVVGVDGSADSQAALQAPARLATRVEVRLIDFGRLFGERHGS